MKGKDTYIEKFANELRFQRLLDGTWDAPLSPREQMLEDAANEYHDRCDAYDQRVCTAISPYTGEPIPETFSQQNAIYANARSVAGDIMTSYGITGEELHKAIVAYGRKYRR